MTDTMVFVVSDDSAVRDSLAELVATAGLRTETFPSLEAWRDAVGADRCGCLVLDAGRRDSRGASAPESVAAICAQRPVLLLVDRGDVPEAVRAIRDGAVDVMEKPWRDQSVLERIRRAMATEQNAKASG